MKKSNIFIIFSVIIFSVFLLTSCGNNESSKKDESDAPYLSESQDITTNNDTKTEIPDLFTNNSDSNISIEDLTKDVLEEKKGKYTLSSKENDKTIIYMLGTVLYAYKDLLESPSSLDIACSTGGLVVKEAEKETGTSFEKIVKYCKENNEHSDTDQCKYIITFYDKCY